MNKLFIILLAIGLASAHTFVKRDAPVGTSTENYIVTAQKQVEVIADKLKEAFDPDAIKKNFNDIVDKVAEAANNLKPKENKE